MAARVWRISPVRLLRLFGASVLISPTLLFSSQLALAQFSQQGPKLVGAGGAGGDVEQGYSVALSGDGNTAIVGGRGDNSYTGAAWVYTRSGGVWTQQGSKLVGTGTGAVGSASQGFSVALSGDGNTAIAGGYGDNVDTGAAWVFVQPRVPFLAFSAQLQIAFGRTPNHDAFALKSSFTLSSTAPAINAVTQPVTLQAGTFTTTIPSGSFSKHRDGSFTFAGVINGVRC